MIIINNNPQNFRAVVDGHNIHINYLDGVSTTHSKRKELQEYYENGVDMDVSRNIQVIESILNPPVKSKPRKRSSN